MKSVRTIGLAVVLLTLVAGAVLVTMGRSRSSPVGFQALMEMAADTQRDLTQLEKQATRVSDAEEMEVGAEIARRFTGWWPVAGRRVNQYVGEVGAALVPFVRRPGITYSFHVIDNPMINAFALPGGQVFVMRGMLEFVQTEAELAAILGHEMTHIDLRHCIELFQEELVVKKAADLAGRTVGGGLARFIVRATGQVAVLTWRIITMGYQRFQEFEADAQGWSLAVAAGYDPDAAMITFSRLDDQFGREPAPTRRNPTAEIADAIKTSAGSYFHSHPPTRERIQRLREIKERSGGGLAGKTFYVGRGNLRDLTARRQREYGDPGERRTY
ncbi:MAG: M48 family metalloprotease [Candidatus Riflebacteria bacterium]|nr:M48 family metalloprotease [Candidatus Riflebacteria bacterium]